MDSIHSEKVVTCAGEDCCGGKTETPPPLANNGKICHNSSAQQATCCANDNENNVSYSDYCEDNDRCDESCIKAAAAIECSISCSGKRENSCANTCGSEMSGDVQHSTQHNRGEDVNNHIDNHVSSSDDDKHRKLDYQYRPQKHKDNIENRHFNEACSTHLRAAMDKYTSYLESAKCICRSVLQNTETIKHCKPLPKKNAACQSTSAEHHLQIEQYGNVISRHQTSRKQKCCDSVESCNDDEEIVQILVDSDPSGKTCEDLEKGRNVKHVVMNVTGMDCSGCANNLSRALSSIPSVSSVKVIFISGIAEFNLDTNIIELAEVIRKAQRATGYKLSPFSSDAQILEVVMDANKAKAFQDNMPCGVDNCTNLTNTTYAISYDPCIIGARDVLAQTHGQLAPPRNGSNPSDGRHRLIRVSIMTVTSSALTIPVIVLAWGTPSSVSENVALIIELILATLVQVIAIKEFYQPAISSLIFNKTLEMDMLVVISITAAYGYSVVALALTFTGARLQTKPFFETSTLLITLILLGRLLAAWARKRAVAAVSMRSLQISTAVIVDISGDTRTIDARLLAFGDTIEIQPYMQVVTDANVLSGTSEVDESMLTGESAPILKTAGSLLISGTVNGSGKLTAKVARLPGRNTITDIANLVEQAQSSKPRVQDLADKIAGHFIPVVVGAAIVVLLIWIVILLKVRKVPVDETVGTAIGYCIAVLAISCPCALGLAVPMVLVVAGGIAARAGVIIKTADVIERGFKVTDVVFDKTGTLTEPNLEVVQELIIPNDEIDETTARSIILAMVKGNNHPVSQAVGTSLVKQHVISIEVKDVRSIPGGGIEAVWNSMSARVGNSKWLNVLDQPQVISFATQRLTMLCATINGRLFAIYGLKSVIRTGAAAVVQDLHRRGIRVHVVSGDVTEAVRAVAQELRIDLENIAAEKTPAQKQEYVRQLMNQKRVTLFCGDGTNDAVAVAQADIGVQIESSSDVTRATADVVLLHNLDGVIGILDVSKAAFRRIIFNFLWSAIYNVVAILLASGAFVKVRIPPAYAGLGEIVSVLPVIVAALTMPKVKALK